ncbi:hypothetical protein [Erythrobacter litoralis]|uniref:Uncharacterized protein n=1 Tax=Erythrobacter litoralis (strain HTCC2594) TaxID=314225 RepID=Q2N6P6_ERYLH|nr:hypothetical protein [Erythrobacter litoralis]ABC64645.1 hypothetical protein ELI_12765 [Erythrobacter litoralis HTCC2594]
MIATSIASAVALLVALQQASDKVEAVYSDEDWTLDYPFVIEPYVGEYYDCLRAGSYTIGEGRTFAAQYREDDLPRCADKGVRLEAEANAVLAGRDSSDAMTPQDVAALFDQIRALHVARGASIDSATRARLVTEPEYRQVRRQAAVASEDTARCVARIDALSQERSAFMADNSDRIEAVHAQDSYSEDDQRELFAYQRQLQRFNSLIVIEQRRCAAAGQRELADFDNAQD